MTLDTTPLHPEFGIEIHGLDLAGVTAARGYPAIREAFERHSLLLFRNQRLDDRHHLDLASLFGPIENRTKGEWGRRPARAGTVSNAGDTRFEDAAMTRLNHQANQLWHTDSTFLPVPALANIITARVVPDSGGETELVSTRAAWRDLPDALRSKARGITCLHRYSHSRARVNAALAARELFTMWPDQAWRAVWVNPVTGQEALYIASHAYAVAGMGPQEGEALIEELIARATRPRYVYSHRWRPGDVLIWDERATLHRGRPWPYAEERTLASLCVSATERDGLASVRPPEAA